MQSINQAGSSNAMLVQQKFRSKAQLHQYLTQRLRVFLPPKSSCRMEWLVAVFEGKKRVLMSDAVPHYTVPSDPEVCVKLLFPELMEDEELMSFFDTERYIKSQKLPTKPFFWGVMYATRREFVQALLDEIVSKKMQGSKEKADAMGQIQFDAHWMGKLMEYTISNQGKCLLDSLQWLAENSTSPRGLVIPAYDDFVMQPEPIGKAKKPSSRKPIEMPSTIREYQQQLANHLNERNITVRKKPNVIGNAEEQKLLE